MGQYAMPDPWRDEDWREGTNMSESAQEPDKGGSSSPEEGRPAEGVTEQQGEPIAPTTPPPDIQPDDDEPRVG